MPLEEEVVVAFVENDKGNVEEEEEEEEGKPRCVRGAGMEDGEGEGVEEGT